MLKKIKIIIVIASLSITLCLMSNTYSRYVASSENTVNAEFAKWQILVNKEDITNESTANIIFKPTIEANSNVAEGKIAPSSKGYFDIEIDPTNVDVSFKYTIDLAVENKNMPDLMITKYALLPKNYIEGNSLEYNSITNGTIENTLNYINDFEKFTIRIYFEWYEGVNEHMNDSSDTKIGSSDSQVNFTISADINFEQVI